MTYRGSFPNPDRPIRWEGEEDHYRSDFTVGDHVRGEHGLSGTITAFNNTWSHIHGGRIVHITPDPVPPPGKTYGTERTCWEHDLTAAQPDDVPSHVDREGYGWKHIPASWMVTV